MTFSGAFASAVLYIISTMIKWYIEKTPGDFMELLRYAALLLALGLMYSAINLPVAFRFGVERGRLWFILVTVLVAAAIGTIISLIETDVSKVGNFIISLPSIAYIAASLILIALSVIISFRIFENKEL